MQAGDDMAAAAAAAAAAQPQPMSVDPSPAAAPGQQQQQQQSGPAGVAPLGGGGGPSSATLPDPLEGHPVYVSFEEKKEVAEGRRSGGRKSGGGHTYVVKFFLVDTHGTEYLAATGEDQGDAHYLYENQTGFPFLRANNKGEVRLWLENIIDLSKDRGGLHGHLVQDEVPQDPNKIRLPKFVGHTQEKRELSDGRHRIEWFLMDEADNSHLAIVGEEKETRDGHYLYRTQGVFDKALPLQVGNQREVERWLDVMVFHGGVAPPGAAGADSQGGPTLSGLSGHRGTSSRGGGGGHGARPGGGQKKAAGAQKHDLLRQATTNAKKVKTGVAGRLGADPDQEARDVVAAELQRWAQEEAQRREAAKRQALAYAMDPLASKEAASVRRCLAALQQAAQQAGFLPPGTGRAGTHQQQANLVDTLGALRELAHMYSPLSLLATPELKECLGQLQTHQHPEVKRLATSVLELWLRNAVAQMEVLSDPRYVQDPRSVLEGKLSSREEMDPIVAAVTHRTLHPPAPAAGAQQLQQQERAGSRLGHAAGAAAAAPGGQAAGEATPGAVGALSARPSSAQSLQALMGGSGAGEGAAPATAVTTGGGGGAGMDASALAAAQTGERRRLNLDLDAFDSPQVVLTAAGMRRQQQLSVSSSGEEEEDQEAAAAAAAAGGAPPEDDPSSAQPSSLLGGATDSGAQQSRSARGGGSLTYAASVDLINAPVSMEESEQAEMLE